MPTPGPCRSVASSVSVNVNSPRRSTSWTSVPNESVNLLVSPVSRVVVMYRVVEGCVPPGKRRGRERTGLRAREAASPARRTCVRRRTSRDGVLLSRRVSEEIGQSPEVEPQVTQPAEVSPRDSRRRKQSRVDATRTCPGQDVDVDDHVEQVDECRRRACRDAADSSLSELWVGKAPPALRHCDACDSRLISRATPAIQIARLTPPVMVVARRSSCVNSVTGDGLSNVIAHPSM